MTEEWCGFRNSFSFIPLDRLHFSAKTVPTQKLNQDTFKIYYQLYILKYIFTFLISKFYFSP